MIVAFFILFGAICTLAGALWGQRHPKIVSVVRPASEDTARLDYIEAQQAHLAREQGYWSCLTGHPRRVSGISWGMREAIDIAMAKHPAPTIDTHSVPTSETSTKGD